MPEPPVTLSLEQYQQLTELLDRIELPPCSCKIPSKQICIILYGPQGCTVSCMNHESPRGCEQRTETGKCAHKKISCQCPKWPTKKCSHILSHWHRFTIREWVMMLKASNFAEYKDSEEPTFPTLFIAGSEEKISLMRDRVAAGFSPFHPLDVPHKKSKIEVKVTRGDNGAVHRLGYTNHRRRRAE